MKMASGIYFQDWIEKHHLRANPSTLYVFGDNMEERGFGGQAREMRGEKNAVGIPTKWSPSMKADAFFSDEDFESVKDRIDARIAEIEAHLEKNGRVILPRRGLGNGLSELDTRAPMIHAYIQEKLQHLITKYPGK
jgi:hypothetical protein